MPQVADTVWFVAGSSSTTDFSDGTALSGSRNMVGGATSGKTYSYRAEHPSNDAIWENGYGLWNGTTLVRTVVASSAGGTTTVDFAAAPVVLLTPMKRDWDALVQSDIVQALTSAQRAQARANVGSNSFARVRVAATGNVTLATGLENADTLDGVTLATGDRVLLPNQTTTNQNGIYVVVASGAAARAGDFTAYNDHPGVYVSVAEGTVYADTLWRCTSNAGGTIDSTALAFQDLRAIYSGGPQSGYLNYVSATQLNLKPFNGDRIKIAGVWYDIPSGGVTVANTSIFVNGVGASNLGASTLYLVCAFINSGVLTLDFHTVITHISDTTAGNVGTEIKSGDNSRTVIGLIRTNASSQFSAALTLSWFNRRRKTLTGTLPSNRTTTSTSYVEINSADRLDFLCWGDDAPTFHKFGWCSMGTTGVGFVHGLGIDSASTRICLAGATSPVNGYNINTFASEVYQPAEGYHYATHVAAVDSGTLSFGNAFTYTTIGVNG